MRILVAEDDAVSQKLLAKVLESMGHQAVVTGDGEQAWEQYKREPFSVVVTDWMMPGTDGLELVKRIRSTRSRIYPWVVMLTAMDFKANYQQAIDQGVDDFLSKPLDRDLLRVRLAVAERIHAMSEQVAALSSALPICMHCKAIRSTGETWRKVEEYFKEQSNIDFSHSYCPDCFYQHSLEPELVRFRSSVTRPPIPSTESRIDRSVIDPLLAFDGQDSPGLFDDMLDGLRATATTIREDLAAIEHRGLRGEETIHRLRRFAERCRDLGAGKLFSLLARCGTLSDDEILTCHDKLGSAATKELDDLLSDLAAEQEKRKAPAPASA